MKNSDNKAKSVNGFNSAEATALANKRWSDTLAEMNDSKISEEDRPKEHKSDSGGSVWGQSRLHMQASVNNFMRDLSELLNRTAPKNAK